MVTRSWIYSYLLERRFTRPILRRPSPCVYPVPAVAIAVAPSALATLHPEPLSLPRLLLRVFSDAVVGGLSMCVLPGPVAARFSRQSRVLFDRAPRRATEKRTPRCTHPSRCEPGPSRSTERLTVYSWAPHLALAPVVLRALPSCPLHRRSGQGLRACTCPSRHFYHTVVQLYWASPMLHAALSRAGVPSDSRRSVSTPHGADG